MPPTKELPPGVAELDPESRAVVELSARRGMSDQEIASLINLDPDYVRRRREEATAALEARSPRRRLGRPLAVVAGVVVAGAVAAVLIASGGDDKTTSPGSEPAPSTRDGEAPPRGTGPVVPFRRLNDTHGRGTVQVVQSGGRARLQLRVGSFLVPQRGGYGVWLYSSPSMARQLLATRSTTIRRDLTLPGNWRRYRYVDVSREVTSDPAYSGLTLLRAPVARLGG